ncbi:hypothetical protein Tco_1115320 [Tanacetum coccineum]
MGTDYPRPGYLGQIPVGQAFHSILKCSKQIELRCHDLSATVWNPLSRKLFLSEVGAAAVASPVRVLELDTHSSSESSLPLVSVAPMVSPFLCSDDSESDTEIPERHVSSTPHDVMLARWSSKVASRSSSPTTSTLKILTAPIPLAPSAIVAPSSNIISPVDAPPRIRRR